MTRLAVRGRAVLIATLGVQLGSQQARHTAEAQSGDVDRSERPVLGAAMPEAAILRLGAVLQSRGGALQSVGRLSCKAAATTLHVEPFT